MADTLVQRVTGQQVAQQAPVEVELIVSDESLFGGDDSAAHLVGFGPVPATLARRMVRDADRAWVRRLYARPADGSLVSMDSSCRVFRGGLRKRIVLRDQVCRTPWCDAPMRHVDHVTPVAAAGSTDADNAQGLCEACNYAKEAPGWRSRRRPDLRHLVEFTTPTGHAFESRPPPPPGRRRRRTLEERLRSLAS